MHFSQRDLVCTCMCDNALHTSHDIVITCLAPPSCNTAYHLGWLCIIIIFHINYIPYRRCLFLEKSLCDGALNVCFTNWSCVIILWSGTCYWSLSNSRWSGENISASPLQTFCIYIYIVCLWGLFYVSWYVHWLSMPDLSLCLNNVLGNQSMWAALLKMCLCISPQCQVLSTATTGHSSWMSWSGWLTFGVR